MSYDFSNCTLFGIQNKAERYAYIGWIVFVITCSLLGDTTILVASIRYKAFKLQKIVVAFIQHIAVCDLLLTISTIIPQLVSLIKDRKSNNKLLPIMSFFVTHYVYGVSIILVSAMTLGKLLSLKYPFRAGTWTTAKIHKFCAGIWITALSSPVLQILIDKEDIVFDCRVNGYMHSYTSSIWKILLPILSLVVLVTPNVIIVVSTVLLLKEARRVVTDSRESPRWQGIMTVVITATVSIITFLPPAVYLIAEPFIVKDPSVPGPFYKVFYRFCRAVTCVNILANFFVYSLTVTSFRNFLKSKFKQAFSFRSNKFTKGTTVSRGTTKGRGGQINRTNFTAIPRQEMERIKEGGKSNLKSLEGPTKEIDIVNDGPLEVKTTERVTKERGTEKGKMKKNNQIDTDNQPIEIEETGI